MFSFEKSQGDNADNCSFERETRHYSRSNFCSKNVWLFILLFFLFSLGFKSVLLDLSLSTGQSLSLKVTVTFILRDSQSIYTELVIVTFIH